MEKVNASGMDKSKYLRALVKSGGAIDTSYTKDRTNLIRQISGIATNINQIAKAANIMGFVPNNDLIELKELLLEIQNLLREGLIVWQSQKSCI